MAIDHTLLIELPDGRKFPQYIKKNPDLTAYTRKIDFITSLTERELAVNVALFDVKMLRAIATDLSVLSEKGVKLSRDKLVILLTTIKNEALESRLHIFREINHLLETEGYTGKLLELVLTKQTTTSECINFVIDSLVRTDEARKVVIAPRFKEYTIRQNIPRGYL
jgi:hypothetical protein